MSNNLKKLEQSVSFFAHKIKTDIIFKIRTYIFSVVNELMEILLFFNRLFTKEQECLTMESVGDVSCTYYLLGRAHSTTSAKKPG